MLDAKKRGVDFSSTLTLGRQKNNMTSSELAHLRDIYGVPKPYGIEHCLKFRSNADPFFYHYLGVIRLSTLDISSFEGADIIHDMNDPIPENLEKSFDVVVDGGTLEHIFNFPTAITNCMRMLKEGGNLFIFSMANNHCGHGFYQFSPELFFRILQAENGFETKSVILLKHPFPGAELSRKQECFKVQDPRTLGKRSLLVTNSPVGIMVHAEKKAHRDIFKQYPQQSDYVIKWARGDENKKSTSCLQHYPPLNENRNDSIKQCWNFLPLRLKLLITGFHLRWKYSLKRDKEFYSRW